MTLLRTAPSLDLENFEAAATHIGAETIGVRRACDHAGARDQSLFAARKHVNFGPADLFGPRDEIGAVFGLAGRRGRHQIETLDAQLINDRAVTPQRAQRAIHAFPAQTPVRCKPAPQPA